MLEMEIIEPNMIEMEISGQTPSTIGGTTNYNELSSKPKINGIELRGDKSLDEFNIASKDYVEQEIATFDFVKIVSELPETGLQNRTYLVTKENATENDLYDEYLWVNKGTEEEPNWIWEYQGTKTIEVDLTNYVKKTDYATANVGGTIKVNSNFGITIRADGIIMPASPSKSELDLRTNTVRPLTPHLIDYAVKKALSDCKLIDSDVWTDVEKASARTLINAQKKIPDASGGVATARIVDADGNLNMNIYSRGSAHAEKLLCGSKNGWGIIENSEITRTQLEKQLGDYNETKGSLQSQVDTKADKSAIPTNVSQLTNDSDYATKSYVDEEIATFDFIKVVDELPKIGLPNRIYFVPKANAQTQDLFDEYIWVNGDWEFVTTKQLEVDLTDYAKKSDIPANEIAISLTEPTTDEKVWIQNGKNLFNKNSALIGYELISYDPGIKANASWFVSDYIPVTEGKTYYLSGKTSGTNNMFYDINKTMISAVAAVTGTITIPAGARYVRFNAKLTDLDTTQLELGNEQSSYEPYVGRNIYVKNNKGFYDVFLSV